MSTFKNRKEALPPMPGAITGVEPEKEEQIKGRVYALYIKGELIEITEAEAIDLMGQIVGIMGYYNNHQEAN